MHIGRMISPVTGGSSRTSYHQNRNMYIYKYMHIGRMISPVTGGSSRRQNRMYI